MATQGLKAAQARDWGTQPVAIAAPSTDKSSNEG